MQEEMDSTDEAMDDLPNLCPKCKEPFILFVKHVCRPGMFELKGDMAQQFNESQEHEEARMRDVMAQADDAEEEGPDDNRDPLDYQYGE